MVRTLIIAAMLAALAGCQGSGAIERRLGEARMPQPVESVELFLDAPPEQPYRTVAFVRGEASTREFVSLAEAEAAAYDALRRYAARAGAHAVVEISRTVLREGRAVHIDIPADAMPVAVEHTVVVTGRAVIFR